MRVISSEFSQKLTVHTSAMVVTIPFQRDDRMSFVDRFVAEILSLQIALYYSRARLEAGTDSEALHDLRIAVRRIRSLLRPMRSLSEVAATE
ncbi:CHAD domain-containing protein [Pseudomonas sp. Z6-20]|uniref:CHAD domain-containing protein n=2 Tax=unclassified Pseudomonas TaxID=196821 RepID=UPI003DAA2CA5